MPEKDAQTEAREFAESLEVDIDVIAGSAHKGDEEAYLAWCFEQDKREQRERQKREKSRDGRRR